MGLVLEFLESLGLFLCLLLAAPCGYLRRIDRFSLMLRFVPFLLRHRLFSSVLRSRLDFKMRNYQQAVIGLTPVVTAIERDFGAELLISAPLRQLLCALYCDMQQLYILSGQISQAVAVVLRAHKILGLDRLPSNPDFDIKTAHIVKAGLAATKMLEDGGLATLMVRPGEEPLLSRPPFSVPSRTPRDEQKKRSKDSDGAVIIPFPSSFQT